MLLALLAIAHGWWCWPEAHSIWIEWLCRA